MNLLGDKIGTVKETIKTVIDANKDVGLEINIENTKYCLIARMQVKIRT
jgi:biotin operon repressor